MLKKDLETEKAISVEFSKAVGGDADSALEILRKQLAEVRDERDDLSARVSKLESKAK